MDLLFNQIKSKNINIQYIQYFFMLFEVFIIYMYIFFFLNSIVSEQLLRDSNVKWFDIDILFLILVCFFLLGSIGKNIGDIEYELVVVFNISIYCFF